MQIQQGGYVRLVHMNGPRRGEIDKVSKDVVLIGRHPDSDILFPASERTVSRKHAQIIRTGDQYRLLNHSQNGCYVNGRFAHSVCLRNGDVITFSQNGPKLSFLFTLPQSDQANDGHNSASDSRKQKSVSFDEKQLGLFSVQYGTRIISHNKHMISIGRHSDNDIVLDHQGVDRQHAEIRYQLKNFFLRGTDLSSKVYINGRNVTDYTRLLKDDLIMLGTNGPQLRFLGEGRFIEVKLPVKKHRPGTAYATAPSPCQASLFQPSDFQLPSTLRDGGR